MLRINCVLDGLYVDGWSGWRRGHSTRRTTVSTSCSLSQQQDDYRKNDKATHGVSPDCRLAPSRVAHRKLDRKGYIAFFTRFSSHYVMPASYVSGVPKLVITGVG